MDVFARLIKLKPDSRLRVQAWAKQISDRRSEALATLQKEGVQLESYHLMTIEGEDYLLLYMRSENIEVAIHTGSEALSEIDELHQQFKIDTWIRGAGCVGELILDLANDQVISDE